MFLFRFWKQIVLPFVHSIYITRIHQNSPEYDLLIRYFGYLPKVITSCMLREAAIGVTAHDVWEIRILGRRLMILLAGISAAAFLGFVLYTFIFNLWMILATLVLGIAASIVWLTSLYALLMLALKVEALPIYNKFWQIRLLSRIPLAEIVLPLIIGVPYALMFMDLSLAETYSFGHYIEAVIIGYVGINWLLSMIVMFAVHFFGIVIIIIVSTEQMSSGERDQTIKSLALMYGGKKPNQLAGALRDGEKVYKAGIVAYRYVCRKLQIVD